MRSVLENSYLFGCKTLKTVVREKMQLVDPQRNKLCILCGNKIILGNLITKKSCKLYKKTYLQTLSLKVSYEN